MLVKAKVFPCAREEEVIAKSQDSFEIRIKEKPRMGQANKGVIRVMAGYFKVPESKVRIIKGFREPSKILEIKGR